MDRILRNAAPLVLVGLALLVWFERWIPGRAWLAGQLGEDAVLRLVTGCVCVYAALLIWERQQMATLFKQVLEQFKRFHEAQSRMRSGDDATARSEAIRILISALGSDDPEVRRSARENLTKLVGRDLGDDPAAWRPVLDDGAPPAG